MRNYKKLILAVLILLLTASCKLKEKEVSLPEITKNDETINCFIASDLHFLAPEINDGKEAFQKFTSSGDGKELGYINEIVDCFVSEIQKKKPSVVILSGDLTTNGEKISHKALAQKLSAIDPNETKIYVIPGNHDVLNPYARGFEEDRQIKVEYVTPDEFSDIYSDYGYGNAVSRDTDSLSYLAAPSKKYWFLMLDSCRYSYNEILGSPQMNGLIKDTTIKWIESCAELAQEEGAQIIAVMHHNLSVHNDLLYNGYTLDNSNTVVKLFQRLKVELCFSGHIHAQDIVSTQGRYPYDIASGALSVYPQKYGVLLCGEGLEYSTQWIDMETYVKNNNISDKNLLNFKEYTANHFTERSGSMNRFGDECSVEERQQMADTLRELNKNYFAGEEKDNTNLLSTNGYKLLLEQEGFLQMYVQEISEDHDTDDNVLVIPFEK